MFLLVIYPSLRLNLPQVSLSSICALCLYYLTDVFTKQLILERI